MLPYIAYMDPMGIFTPISNLNKVCSPFFYGHTRSVLGCVGNFYINRQKMDGWPSRTTWLAISNWTRGNGNLNWSSSWLETSSSNTKFFKITQVLGNKVLGSVYNIYKDSKSSSMTTTTGWWLSPPGTAPQGQFSSILVLNLRHHFLD